MSEAGIEPLPMTDAGKIARELRLTAPGTVPDGTAPS
jgi:hypothetical protein